MAQITYTNKEALNEIPSIADKNKCKASDMNEIKNVVNENETKTLLSISNTAPSQCSTGDMYFNSTDNLIYTATGTDTWGATGVAPTINTLYIILSEQTLYTYNGSTLVRVGEGAGGETLEIGTILSFAGTTAPDNYMICDGSAISRTTYSQLFDIIGTTYGSGDGSTTFNLPNLKGRVPVGYDSNQFEFDNLGETGGEKTHTLTVSEMPSHNHALTQGYVQAGQTGAFARTEYTATSGNTANSGNNEAHNNLQPYIVVHYIIKVTQSSPLQASVVGTQSNSTTDAYSCDYVNKAIEPNIISVDIPEVNPSLTEWTNYNITTGYTTTTKVGNKLTNNNGIKIGAGVNYVKVNITERIYNGHSDAIVYSATLSKNGNQINYTYDTVYTNGFATLSITSWLIPVQENDVITAGIIAGINNTTTTIRGGILTVEVVN